MAKKISLEELYSYLQTFHLSDSLYLIGQINAAMKYGYDSLATEVSYPIIKWLNQISENQRFYYSTQLTRMARFLLLSGANDQCSARLQLNTPVFERAIELVGSLYDEDVEVKVKSEQDRSKLLGRISQWQFPLQDNRKSLIGRGFLLFITIPELIGLPYDFNVNMKGHFGLGSFEFMATGIVAWLKTTGVLDYDIYIGIDALQSTVTDENQLRFLSLSSGTHEEFKALVRGENWEEVQKLKDIYGMNPFVKIPAIKALRPLHAQRESYIIPQPKYLIDRASSGIFHLLAAKEQELAFKNGHKGENPFRVAFGAVFRAYVGLQLSQGGKSVVFVDMDDDFMQSQVGKKPDFAIVSDGICIQFEVKTSLLRIESRTYFEESALRDEVRAGSLKKAVLQLYTFKEAVLFGKIDDKRFQGVSRVISVIVGYEDIFVLNSSLLPILREEYGVMAVDFQLASISDVDKIGNALADNLNLGSLLAEKLDTPGCDSWSLEAWLRPKVKSDNPVLSNSFGACLQKLGFDDRL